MYNKKTLPRPSHQHPKAQDPCKFNPEIARASSEVVDPHDDDVMRKHFNEEQSKADEMRHPVLPGS